MKTVSGLRLVRVGGGEALAAFLSSDGGMSPLSECVAKMAVMSDGAHAAGVLVLAPADEFLDSDLTNYDWLRRWNRLRVYHEPDESPEQASASEHVERLLAEGLREHVKDADPSVADSILEEAFGEKLMGWSKMQHASDDDDDDGAVEEVGPKLDLIEVRDIEDEERERLLTEVPEAWKSIIEDSRVTAEYHELLEVEGQDVRKEGQDVRKDTRRCWQRPRFFASLGIGAALGGVFMSGLTLYLSGRGEAGPCVLSPATTLNSSTSPNSSTGSEVVGRRALYDVASSTVGYDSTMGTAASDTVGSSLGTDDPTFRGVTDATCKPVVIVEPRWPNVDDITTLISESELASLTVPEDICAARNITSGYVIAHSDNWGLLKWSDCADNGGHIACGKDTMCYYYGYPFKFDGPTVFKAVVQYRGPDGCSMRCNEGDLARDLYHNRVAEGVGRSIPGVDFGHASDRQKRLLGREIDKHLKRNDQCSYFNPEDGCRPRLARPQCTCTKARYASKFYDPEGKLGPWATQLDFNTTEDRFAPYHTPHKVPGYVTHECIFDCYQADSNMDEEVLKYWRSIYSSHIFSFEDPLEKDILRFLSILRDGESTRPVSDTETPTTVTGT
ncbi:putative transmembrane protein [Gregarina niphandrodes]|uniref:Transmembrane protein n=1 Tax=Gregarina niphandrodes TaxID=110365 RepID=A0A023BAG7_GRENI|nr:putative transmembrane protein [Gregarina niphandrodes]EZG78293.1 putative transmembrane protein [Gregarina niphandrodes]|eukprot:XP_011129362.1 putative transmembrane protein [Gregarina niphandrodes]